MDLFRIFPEASNREEVEENTPEPEARNTTSVVRSCQCVYMPCPMDGYLAG